VEVITPLGAVVLGGFVSDANVFSYKWLLKSLLRIYSFRSKLQNISRILNSQSNFKFDQDYRKKYKNI